jgi:hypothetical protein
VKSKWNKSNEWETNGKQKGNEREKKGKQN